MGCLAGYDGAGIGGGEFALRLVPRQSVALLYQWSGSHTHTHTHMRPPVSGTEHAGFSKQDARGKLVVASLPANVPFSTFC